MDDLNRWTNFEYIEGVAKLEGSEKQVAWAEQIREKTIQRFLKGLQEVSFQDRDLIIKRINNVKSAKFFIEEQNWLKNYRNWIGEDELTKKTFNAQNWKEKEKEYYSEKHCAVV